MMKFEIRFDSRHDLIFSFRREVFYMPSTVALDYVVVVVVVVV